MCTDGWRCSAFHWADCPLSAGVGGGRGEPHIEKARESEWEREREKAEERRKRQKGENNKGSLFVLFCSEKEGREALPFWDWLTEIEAAVSVYVCIRAFVFVCLCVCVWVCVCLCVCMWVWVCACIQQWIGFNPSRQWVSLPIHGYNETSRISSYPPTPTSTPRHTHTYTHKHIHTYTHSYRWMDNIDYHK